MDTMNLGSMEIGETRRRDLVAAIERTADARWRSHFPPHLAVHKRPTDLSRRDSNVSFKRPSAQGQEAKKPTIPAVLDFAQSVIGLAFRRLVDLLLS